MWLTEEEADTYFETRLGASALWTDSTDKTAALTTAQAQIVNCAEFTFTDEELEEPTTAMQNAVCEQALFLLRDPDMESRLALQAQGVTQAGIVQETYGGRRGLFPIAIQARAELVTGGHVVTAPSRVRWER